MQWKSSNVYVDLRFHYYRIEVFGRFEHSLLLELILELETSLEYETHQLQ